MGERGPAPKRSDQRRRENKPPQEPTKAPGAEVVEVPAPDPGWHPLAVEWFESLGRSGQSAFYEPSDWAAAKLLAESISRELKPQQVVTEQGVVEVLLPPKAASVTAWLRGMTALLVTEGDRRRAAMELQRPRPAGGEGGDGNVSELDDWRLRLRGGAAG